ncbi:MAG: DUF4167 domain-containing protein [Hyphomicrobiales bacterium]
MRQNHQNKRLRGRNRKGPNPLTRSYESNGPDVKVRGTALHIAEKYVALSRDAQASGDPVAAENYMQHAEHYYRIIAAAQAQMPQQMQIVRDDDNRDDDDEMDEVPTRASMNPVAAPGAPQPVEFREQFDQEAPSEAPRPNGGNGSTASEAGAGEGSEEGAQRPRRRGRGRPRMAQPAEGAAEPVAASEDAGEKRPRPVRQRRPAPAVDAVAVPAEE